MSSVSPFRKINGATASDALATAQRQALEQSGVPIVGQPLQVHGVQFILTASCLCSTPNPVLIFDGRKPAACPACHAVYAVVQLAGEPQDELTPHGEIMKLRVMVARVGTAVSTEPAAPGA
jgi:hypothetical protein